MIKGSRLSILGAAVIALTVAPAMAQNLLLNPGFESGYTTNWTLNAGSLNGQGLGEDPHTGSKSWHGAWQWSGSAQTTTYYQDVAVSAGSICDASMWCKADAWGGVYGNDTHSFRLRIRFRDSGGANLETHDANSPQPNNTWQQLVLSNMVAPAGTVTCRVMFSYITTQQAHEWKVWNIDDLSLTVQSTGQHAVSSITPNTIADNSSNTAATISGVSLTGATAVKLVQGTTVLTPTGAPPFTVSGDGLSITCTFPTSGAPFGLYDVVVEKTGFTTQTLVNGFAILNPSAAPTLLLNGGFEDVAGNMQDWYGAYYRQLASSGSVHTPAAPYNPMEGSYYWYIGRDYTDTQEVTPGFWQVVSVPVASSVFLEGFVHVGPGTNAVNTVTIRLRDGAGTDGTILAEAVVDRTTPHQTGDWSKVSLRGRSTAGQVTVEVSTRVKAASTGDYHNDTAAVFLDAFKLYTTNPCVATHTLNMPAGAPVDFNNAYTPTVTVTGTNLQQVTAVRLVQLCGNGTFVEGTVNSNDGSTLVATFDFGPEGAPTGRYNLMTDQTLDNNQCISQVLDEAYRCRTTILSVGTVYDDPPKTSLTMPQGVVRLLFQGRNVDLFDSIKLVYVPAKRNPPNDRAPYWMPNTFTGNPDAIPESWVLELEGTQADISDPNNVAMDFNLISGQPGWYKVVAHRNTLGCSGDVVLDNAFELKLPEVDGVNIVDRLQNGGFENGDASWVLTPDPLSTGKGVPMPGVQIALANSTEGFPKVPGIDPPTYPGDEELQAHGGQHLAGCYSFTYGSGDPNLNWDTWQSPNNGTLAQTVAIGTPGEYSLIMTYWVRLWDELYPEAHLFAALYVDGVKQTATETRVQFPDVGYASQDGWDPWTQLSVSYIGPVSDNVGVEFYFKTQGGDGSAGSGAATVIGVDDVQLLTVPTCPARWADADGDGDVDQADFAVMQVCFSGNGIPAGADCQCFDRPDPGQTTADGDVDQTDIQAFEGCASGPGIEADPDCDNGL